MQTHKLTCDRCGKTVKFLGCEYPRGWRGFDGNNGAIKECCPECSRFLKSTMLKLINRGGKEKV